MPEKDDEQRRQRIWYIRVRIFSRLQGGWGILYSGRGRQRQGNVYVRMLQHNVLQ